MYEEGVVIEIQEDKILVKLDRQERCSECRGCREAADGFMVAEAEGRPGVTAGSKVALERKWEDVRVSVLLVLLIPLVALVGGSVIGYLVLRNFIENAAMQNIGGVFFGMVLMVISMGYARRYDKKIRQSNFGKMKIVKIIK